VFHKHGNRQDRKHSYNDHRNARNTECWSEEHDHHEYESQHNYSPEASVPEVLQGMETEAVVVTAVSSELHVVPCSSVRVRVDELLVNSTTSTNVLDPHDLMGFTFPMERDGIVQKAFVTEQDKESDNNFIELSI